MLVCMARNRNGFVAKISAKRRRRIGSVLPSGHVTAKSEKREWNRGAAASHALIEA